MVYHYRFSVSAKFFFLLLICTWNDSFVVERKIIVCLCISCKFSLDMKQFLSALILSMAVWINLFVIFWLSHLVNVWLSLFACVDFQTYIQIETVQLAFHRHGFLAGFVWESSSIKSIFFKNAFYMGYMEDFPLLCCMHALLLYRVVWNGFFIFAFDLTGISLLSDFVENTHGFGLWDWFGISALPWTGSFLSSQRKAVIWLHEFRYFVWLPSVKWDCCFLCLTISWQLFSAEFSDEFSIFSYSVSYK